MRIKNLAVKSFISIATLGAVASILSYENLIDNEINQSNLEDVMPLYSLDDWEIPSDFETLKTDNKATFSNYRSEATSTSTTPVNWTSVEVLGGGKAQFTLETNDTLLTTENRPKYFGVYETYDTDGKYYNNVYSEELIYPEVIFELHNNTTDTNETFKSTAKSAIDLGDLPLDYSNPNRFPGLMATYILDGITFEIGGLKSMTNYTVNHAWMPYYRTEVGADGAEFFLEYVDILDINGSYPDEIDLTFNSTPNDEIEIVAPILPNVEDASEILKVESSGKKYVNLQLAIYDPNNLYNPDDVQFIVGDSEVPNVNCIDITENPTRSNEEGIIYRDYKLTNKNETLFPALKPDTEYDEISVTFTNGENPYESILGYEDCEFDAWNEIVSKGDKPLFRTATYADPFLESTFTFTGNVTDTSANFQFTYIDEEKLMNWANSNPTNPFAQWLLENVIDDIFYDFDPESSVHLYYNYDDSRDASGKDTYDQEEELDITYLGKTDGYEGMDGVRTTVKYSINNLFAAYDYTKSFALYIEPNGIEDGYGTPGFNINEQENVFHPKVDGFWTEHSATFYWYVILLLVLIIVLVLVIIGIFFAIGAYRSYVGLAIFYDPESTSDNGEVTLNLINAHHYKHIWNSHEDSLVLIASGKPINAIFRRAGALNHGFKVVIEDDFSEKVNLFKYTEAFKDNKFYVGVRGMSATWHANNIHDRHAERLLKKHHLTPKELYEANKSELISTYSDKQEAKAAKSMPGGDIIHIEESKSTPTSFRCKVLLPLDDQLITNHEDIAEKFKLYYTYNGLAYPLKSKLVSHYGTLFEFDFYNLEPGTVYAGLSYAHNNKGVHPSPALYAITRDPMGNEIDIDAAHIAKPRQGEAPEFRMWNINEGKLVLGEKMLNKTLKVLVKKHYEDEEKHRYVKMEDALNHIDDYVHDWEDIGDAFDKAHRSERIAKEKDKVEAKVKKPSVKKTTPNKETTTNDKKSMPKRDNKSKVKINDEERKKSQRTIEAPIRVKTSDKDN